MHVTDLTRVHLDGANLEGAQFFCSTLDHATMTGADLRGANLVFASLRHAQLSRANLQKVQLGAAVLVGTDLTYTIFTGADITTTVFVDVDLSAAIGLEIVHHLSPSHVGIDSLYKSKGKIPEAFLRGCGVPEDFITYARALSKNPIEYNSCFISYSSKDKDFADRLHADLQTRAIRCWYAPEDLKIGDKFRVRIEESIRIYDKVMIVLSEDSIRSAWVEDEVETALENERRNPDSLILFPIRLDDAIMETEHAWAASLRRTRHVGDFSNWKNHDAYQKALKRLLRDLKSQTKATRAPGLSGQ
ncbi:MAG TPA: toll/interleukin-1 receptor domain-containing protein [Candidatus Angelobacter sp.]|nr:toll/interleukin-1 receptor domain-containing protein [Candidatus Angelobacter sp.]